MKIATFNINGIKARAQALPAWLDSAQPDVVLLQELKGVEETFPALEIGDLGYNVRVSGQKTYNGVAILSKSPIEVELTALPGDDRDDHARYIEALVTPKGGNVVRVGAIYLPNGNPTRNEDGKVTPLDVKAGDKILFGKWSGTEVKVDGQDLLIMKESDILGIIE